MVNGFNADKLALAGIQDDSFATGYNNSAAKRRQQSQQDAQLAQLIKGQQMKQEADDAAFNRDRTVFDDMVKNSPKDVSIRVGDFSRGGKDDYLSKLILGNQMGQQQDLKKAQIPNFQVADPNIIPTEKSKEEVMKAATGAKNLEDIMVDLEGKLQDAGPFDRFGSFKIPFTTTEIGTKKGKDLEALKTEAMLIKKDQAGLGALAGPDMALLEQNIGGVTGVGSMFNKASEHAERLRDASNRANKGAATLAQQRGYAPNPGVLVPRQAPQQQQAAPQAQSKPRTIQQNGHTYTLNPQTGQYE